MNYRIKSFANGQRFHVIDEPGHEVYDGAPYGQDKPLVFKYSDDAMECAKRCTEESKQEGD